MRALVTGGAGFVGSTLVDRLLAGGLEVDVVDDLSTGSLENLAPARADGQRRFSFTHLDVRDEELLDVVVRRPPDVVFHLAAAGGPARTPRLDAETTVGGTVAVLDAAVRAQVPKVVFASCAGVYGAAEPVELPLRETHPHRPLTPWAVAKDAAAAYLPVYRDRHGLAFTTLVLGNVYGPRQRPDAGVVARFAARLSAGQPGTITGDGTQTRDFVFVDDAVDALVRAAAAGDGHVLNVGTGAQTSVAELHALVAEAAGADPALAPERVPALPGDLPRVALDTTKAAVHLGWRAWTPVAAGVAAVVDWFRRRP